MSKKRIPVAICYDFDGTLIRGNMQENSFIPGLGMEPEEFWGKVKHEAEKQDMDEVLAYMELMVSKARENDQPLNRASLKKHGKNVTLFPGLEKWFGLINEQGTTLGLAIEHYIISSGIEEMIKGSPISRHFKHIFASGFAYDANDVPRFAARSVNYTTKTQYLFRINKGVLNSWDNRINQVMDESERLMPFSRMIYLGDGDTDVPAMKMLNYQGGYSVAVYPPPEGKRRTKKERIKRDAVRALHNQNRSQFVAEANYEESSDLFNIVVALLSRIAAEEKYGMNRNA